VLWETDEPRPGRIRHRHQGLPGGYAQLVKLVDRVADLEGVKACHVSRWTRRITIDCRPGRPGAHLILDRAERILEGWRAANSRQVQLTSGIAPPALDSTAPSASGWKRLPYAALAGGSFTMTLVGLVVPGVPTVPFLLATSYYLTRSSPRMNERLRRTAFFGPILQEWEGHTALSLTSKGKLLVLTATVVLVTVVFAPLTPLALCVILLISSLSVYGVIRMSAIEEPEHGGPLLDGQAFLSLSAP